MGCCAEGSVKTTRNGEILSLASKERRKKWMESLRDSLKTVTHIKFASFYSIHNIIVACAKRLLHETSQLILDFRTSHPTPNLVYGKKWNIHSLIQNKELQLSFKKIIMFKTAFIVAENSLFYSEDFESFIDLCIREEIKPTSLFFVNYDRDYLPEYSHLFQTRETLKYPPNENPFVLLDSRENKFILKKYRKASSYSLLYEETGECNCEYIHKWNIKNVLILQGNEAALSKINK
jgi:hypothetical protein